MSNQRYKKLSKYLNRFWGGRGVRGKKANLCRALIAPLSPRFFKVTRQTPHVYHI